MAALRASPLFLPQPLSPSSRSRRCAACRGVAAAARPGPAPYRPGVHGGGAKKRLLASRRRPGWVGLPCCLPATEEGVAAAAAATEEEDGYLAREAGWGVRRMGRVGEEMRRVAQVQAEAFHVPVALFNDFFFDFFKAEVLSALIYRVRNSPPDRRRKVGTALLKACEALGFQWKHRFMVLRAYEDDDGARGLYAKAGYRVVSRDPDWVTWVGRRRRVLMIKELPVHDDMIQQQ
ncbi:hypothetical protein PVAP13_2KG175458 [Panicum virgatum]|uniref:N-acetyltransferase domain-containing protein n=1 Tax=Panicum virgatum TaxID=38727 RepID=A0A8T0W7D9_PANVG|nr:hypothetical protein PVAP13_2KG175458 [Panicum virgatum]